MSCLVNSPFLATVIWVIEFMSKSCVPDVRFLDLFPFAVLFISILLTFHVPISILDKNMILGKHNQQKVRDTLSRMGVTLVRQV